MFALCQQQANITDNLTFRNTAVRTYNVKPQSFTGYKLMFLTLFFGAPQKLGELSWNTDRTIQGSIAE
jgi:hypothetical protein